MRFSAIASNLSVDPREAISFARALGFEGLLFDARTSSFDLTELSQTGRREFRSVVAAQNQSLVGIRASLGPNGFGPKSDIDQLLSQLDAALHAAADLGAQVICIDLGALPATIEPPVTRPKIAPEDAGVILIPAPSAPAPPPPQRVAPPPDPAFVASVDTALSVLCEIADRYRMTVALSSSLASFAALDRAIAAARCPWFGVDLDTVAMIADEWPIDETFSRLGQLIRHVRARDALLGADHRTKPAPIGAGNVRWEETFAALDATGYRGWITIDATEMQDRQQAVAAGREKLRSLITPSRQ